MTCAVVPKTPSIIRVPITSDGETTTAERTMATTSDLESRRMSAAAAAAAGADAGGTRNPRRAAGGAAGGILAGTAAGTRTTAGLEAGVTSEEEEAVDPPLEADDKIQRHLLNTY